MTATDAFAPAVSRCVNAEHVCRLRSSDLQLLLQMIGKNVSYLSTQGRALHPNADSGKIRHNHKLQACWLAH